MPDAYTDNFDLILPEPGGSVDTWGDKLNQNFAQIDSLIEGRVDKSGDTMTGTLINDASIPLQFGGFRDSDGALWLHGPGGSGDNVVKITRAANNDYQWDLDDVLVTGSLQSNGPVAVNGKLTVNSLRPQFLSDAFYSSGSLYIEGPTGGNDDNMIAFRRNGDGDYDVTLSGGLDTADHVTVSGNVTASGNVNAGGTVTANRLSMANLEADIDGSDGDAIFDSSHGMFVYLNGNEGREGWHVLLNSDTLRGGNAVSIDSNAGSGTAAQDEIVTVNVSSTASRTSGATNTLLQAKAMNDHRRSSDHDSRYYTKSQVNDKINANTPIVDAGAVGGFGFFTVSPGSRRDPGDTYPGNELRWASTGYNGSFSGEGSPSGTWRLLGALGNGNAQASLFQRIS